MKLIQITLHSHHHRQPEGGSVTYKSPPKLSLTTRTSELKPALCLFLQWAPLIFLIHNLLLITPNGIQSEGKWGRAGGDSERGHSSGAHPTDRIPAETGKGGTWVPRGVLPMLLLFILRFCSSGERSAAVRWPAAWLGRTTAWER